MHKVMGYKEGSEMVEGVRFPAQSVSNVLLGRKEFHFLYDYLWKTNGNVVPVPKEMNTLFNSQFMA